MNEASGQEIEALLENVECEIPEGISAEKIAAGVHKKKKKAKAKARTLWLRYGAVAACLALIIAAVPTVQYFGGNSVTDDKMYNEGTHPAYKTELGFIGSPSLAYPDSISYWYYLPLENDACLAKEFFFKLDEGKLKETWRELLSPFFKHCGIDVTVADWKTTTVGEKDEISDDGKVITHTPGVKTVHIYLVGEEMLDDHTLKCLVNTIDSISYVKYIKLYYNGEPVAIEGKCPEEGFVNFHVDKAE